LHGRYDLLPPELAWSFGAGHARRVPSAAATRRLVVAQADPPVEMGLPQLSPYTAPAAPGTVVLRGPNATPARVLADIPDSDEIEFDVHGLVDLGAADASMLALTPDDNGRFALTTADVRRLQLRRSPLVVLGACHAAHAAPFVQELWSLPMAFVASGARA